MLLGQSCGDQSTWFLADLRLGVLLHRANIDLTIGKVKDKNNLGLVRRNKIVNEDLERGGFGQDVSGCQIIGQRSTKIPRQVHGSEGTRRIRQTSIIFEYDITSSLHRSVYLTKSN